MKTQQFTKRKSPVTGKPYPRCQFVSRQKQCDKAVYSDGLCWGHYRKDAPKVSGTDDANTTTHGCIGTDGGQRIGSAAACSFCATYRDF